MSKKEPEYMNRQNVYRRIDTWDWGNRKDMSVGELINRLSTLPADAELDIFASTYDGLDDDGYGYTGCEMTIDISHTSPETDEEYKRRIKNVKKRLARDKVVERNTRVEKEKKEREEYERLKKKFGE